MVAGPSGSGKSTVCLACLDSPLKLLGDAAELDALAMNEGASLTGLLRLAAPLFDDTRKRLLRAVLGDQPVVRAIVAMARGRWRALKGRGQPLHTMHDRPFPVGDPVLVGSVDLGEDQGLVAGGLAPVDLDGPAADLGLRPDEEDRPLVSVFSHVGRPLPSPVPAESRHRGC